MISSVVTQPYIIPFALALCMTLETLHASAQVNAIRSALRSLLYTVRALATTFALSIYKKL